MRKRQKLVLSALLLGLAMGWVLFLPLEWKYPATGLLALFTWLLVAWSLRDGLQKIEWLTIPLPPVLFSISVSLFYVLLPEAWWAKAIILIVFVISQYALFLSANIFSVAAIRTIALQRAALVVEYVLTILTGFLLFSTLWSFRLPFWLVGVGVSASSFALLLPGIWSVGLEPVLTRRVFAYAFWQSVCLGLLALSVSFWPISITVSSVFLCTMLYVFLGISQHHFTERLFSKTILEYALISLVVLVTMLLTSGGGV